MSVPTILVADDDLGIRTILEQALKRAGYSVRCTAEAQTLWQSVIQGEGDLVITDVVMPDGNGLELLPKIKTARPTLPVIVMSARNTVLTALKAMEHGAFEYLPKPFDLKELLDTVGRALSATNQTSLVSVDEEPEENLPLIGRSGAMQDIYRMLARLVNTDLTVMITGESGTGKEKVARTLHDYGKRRAGPFVALNMAAIPRDLIESELFGHEKGAFTGAISRSSGRFEQARGGTLFLDEIGDMPPDAQTRLLRILQEGEYTPVGGHATVRADVRIIAATHRDLARSIEEGSFREDLFYRLNVVPIHLPPLRDRCEDIPELASYFLTQISREQGGTAKRMTTQAIDRLMAHRWPGNVRELENLIRRLVVLHTQDILDEDVIAHELFSRSAGGAPEGAAQTEGRGLSQSIEAHLREYFQAHSGEMPASGLYDRILRAVEYPLIDITLEATGGNQIKAAQILGLNRNTLRKKIRDLDIPLPGK